MEKCYKCETPLVDAGGIGVICPNLNCDVIDNIHNVAPPVIESRHQIPMTIASFQPSYNIVLCAPDGRKITINLQTGKVEYNGDIDEAAKLFWEAVEKAFPFKCKCQK